MTAWRGELVTLYSTYCTETIALWQYAFVNSVMMEKVREGRKWVKKGKEKDWMLFLSVRRTVKRTNRKRIFSSCLLVGSDKQCIFLSYYLIMHKLIWTAVHLYNKFLLPVISRKNLVLKSVQHNRKVNDTIHVQIIKLLNNEGTSKKL